MSNYFKRIIAIVLVVANIVASSGFCVLAQSVGNVVSDAEMNGKELKNYYYLYQEEVEYLESVTTIKDDAEEEIEEGEENIILEEEPENEVLDAKEDDERRIVG